MYEAPSIHLPVGGALFVSNPPERIILAGLVSHGKPGRSNAF